MEERTGDAPTAAVPGGGTSGRGTSFFRRPWIRLGAVVAVAVAAGIVVWAIVGTGDGGSSSTVRTSAASDGRGPLALTAQGLETLAGSIGQPIYWAGPTQGYTYELTRTANGNVYVRYLPPGVKAGAPGANYLIVVTYPFRNAYAALRRAAKGKAILVPSGGLALVRSGYPKSVNIAFPHLNYQLEVYDPSPARSLSIATSGLVRPVGR
ncbi:MAG TPA: hypothetical protein VH416_05500 [Gaiellaceae bacterium]